MTAALLLGFAWSVLGLITVPALLGWVNSRGGLWERDPAHEAFFGIVFGPLPLVMFAIYYMFKALGLAAYKVTGQDR